MVEWELWNWNQEMGATEWQSGNGSEEQGEWELHDGFNKSGDVFEEDHGWQS